MNRLNLILIVIFVGLMTVIFTRINNEKEKEEANEKLYKEQQQKLIKQSEDAELERIKREKNTPEYKQFYANKELVEKRIRKKIDSCYEWSKATRKRTSEYVLNSNKLELVMKKEGLYPMKGKFNCYTGIIKGHTMTVLFGAPKASTNGWIHDWDVRYEY